MGSSIIKSELFKNLYSPDKKNLNLISRKSIRKALNYHKFDLVINCAAMARILDCEKNTTKAIDVNIGGTLNLVKEILRHETHYKRKIKLIHISSDGVYPSQKGNPNPPGAVLFRRDFKRHSWCERHFYELGGEFLCHESMIRDPGLPRQGQS